MLEPIRVGVVLSGAVALGSFEAGVMHELLSAVDQGAPLTFDLVAGSSVGAVIGAVAARSLVTGATYRSGLRKWTDITLELLTSYYERPAQARRRDKWPDVALLSTEVLRKTARHYLVHRTDGEPLRQRFPAPRLTLLATLTNLDGLPGTTQPGDEYRYSEAVTFTFLSGTPSGQAAAAFDPVVWERVTEVVLAGAAFPGAFDPVPVDWQRRLQVPGQVQEEWENRRLLEELARMYPGLQARMRYGDGGLLDNQPLERAIGALPRIVGEPGEAGPEALIYDPRRCLIFVEPDPPVTVLDQISAGQPLGLLTTMSRALRLWSLSASPYLSRKRLMTLNLRLERLMEFLALLGQRMRDGFRPAQQVDWLSQVLQAFPGDGDLSLTIPEDEEGVEPGLIEASIYTTAVHHFYRWLADTERSEADLTFMERFGATDLAEQQVSVHRILRMLRQTYLDLWNLEPSDPGRYQRLLEEAHISLALNLGLNRPWILLSYIAPENPQLMLRGEEAIHFGGFFSREFLEHDYEVGRFFARRWLIQTVPEFLPPGGVTPPEPSRDGITWAVLVDNLGPLRRIFGRLVTGAGWGGGGRGKVLTWILGSILATSGASAGLWIVAWPVRWLTGKPDLVEAQPMLAAGGAIFPLALAALLLVQLPGDLYEALVRRWWQNVWGSGRRRASRPRS